MHVHRLSDTPRGGFGAGQRLRRRSATSEIYDKFCAHCRRMNGSFHACLREGAPVGNVILEIESTGSGLRLLSELLSEDGNDG